MSNFAPMGGTWEEYLAWVRRNHPGHTIRVTTWSDGKDSNKVVGCLDCRAGYV